jgi:hypothetical protein
MATFDWNLGGGNVATSRSTHKASKENNADKVKVFPALARPPAETGHQKLLCACKRGDLHKLVGDDDGTCLIINTYGGGKFRDERYLSQACVKQALKQLGGLEFKLTRAKATTVCRLSRRLFPLGVGGGGALAVCLQLACGHGSQTIFALAAPAIDYLAEVLVFAHVKRSRLEEYIAVDDVKVSQHVAQLWFDSLRDAITALREDREPPPLPPALVSASRPWPGASPRAPSVRPPPPRVAQQQPRVAQQQPRGPPRVAPLVPPPVARLGSPPVVRRAPEPPRRVLTDEQRARIEQNKAEALAKRAAKRARREGPPVERAPERSRTAEAPIAPSPPAALEPVPVPPPPPPPPSPAVVVAPVAQPSEVVDLTGDADSESESDEDFMAYFAGAGLARARRSQD